MRSLGSGDSIWPEIVFPSSFVLNVGIPGLPEDEVYVVIGFPQPFIPGTGSAFGNLSFHS